jgi:peptidoglycan/xylan/chitin deacetylase (PgdA/CDA1 family)
MIKNTLIIILFYFQFLLGQNYGSLRVTNYADDRQSAFSLTFDDGLKSQFDYAKPVLDDYAFKGTYYVLPPYLADNNQETIWRYGTWYQFQTLASEGHEIGSHTMNHYDLTTLPWGSITEEGSLLYELYQSKIFIEQKIPSEKCISFNYPYTIHNAEIDSAASLFYENARASGQSANNPIITGNEWFKLKAREVDFSLPRDSAEADLDELYTYLSWLNNSISKNQWGIMIIHDVVPFDSLQPLIEQDVYQPLTTEWLGWLCEFLYAKSTDSLLWVETVGNVTRYIKERESVSYQVLSSTNQQIQINLTDNLDDNIYNYPLSAYIKIPESWYYIRSQQNGNIDTLVTSQTDTGRVVLVKIIPDGGIFNLSPVTATNIVNQVSVPEQFELYQNYPNPFNPSTAIKYQLPSSGNVTLKVYDVLGNEITTLVDEYKLAGNYQVNFQSTFSGRELANGVYFYQLKAGNYVDTKKMILLK